MGLFAPQLEIYEGNRSSISADTHSWLEADKFKDAVSNIDLGIVFFNTCIFRKPVHFGQSRPRNKVRLMRSQMVKMYCIYKVFNSKVVTYIIYVKKWNP